MRLLQLTAGAILLFVGFVQSFWGNDPYLGWAISLVASAYLTLAGHDLLNGLSDIGSNPACRRLRRVFIDYVDRGWRRRVTRKDGDDARGIPLYKDHRDLR